MMSMIVYLASFVVAAAAAREIGHFLGRFKLPHITGYLFVGLLVGPFALNLIPKEATESLRFIDEISLAVIAFIAGSELYIKELRSRIRAIGLNALGVMIAGLVIIGVATFFLTSLIPFTQELPLSGRIAAAILGATILLALSPASTIAVIQEVKARGPFTKTTLSVTVVMDVVIIILFAVSAAVAAALLHNESMNAGFIALLAFDLAIAVVMGWVVGKLLEMVLGTPWPNVVKSALVLFIGFVVFWGGFQLADYSYQNLPFEIHAEPLLAAMIGGFYVTNFTRFRHAFEQVLHDISPMVYVAFFTLTGTALKVDILLAAGGIALILFAVRMLSIFIGSFIGGTLAGEPMRYRRVAWMGLITQAGIALGLAREVAVQFPDTLGDAFATLIIAVVVLNEIFGPFFLKYVLRQVGESQDSAPTDQVRDAVILGIEQQTLTLARQLGQNHWRVVMADTDASHVERLQSEDVTELHIPEICPDCLKTLINPDTDAVVAMLENDHDNLQACKIAVEEFGVGRVIARVNDLTMRDEFTNLGVKVLDPTSAFVSLLEQSVCAPQASALLLHDDPNQEVVQVTIKSNDIHGLLLRDLRLPLDTLVLNVSRAGQSILPHGYTKLQLDDEVTLVGSPTSLEEAARRLGY